MKSLLFTADLIPKIEDGTKTVTRRLNGLKEINKAPDDWIYKQTLPDGMYWFQHPQKEDSFLYSLYVKPPFRPGEVVYVKEKWAVMHLWDDVKPSELGSNLPIWYEDTPGDEPTNCGDDRGKWRSPLFLPERFARYFLRIKDVRPERVNQITEEDAFNEGIDTESEIYCMAENHMNAGVSVVPAIAAYAGLWNKINPKMPFSFNPWCFRIEFERVERPQ